MWSAVITHGVPCAGMPGCIRCVGETHRYRPPDSPGLYLRRFGGSVHAWLCRVRLAEAGEVGAVALWREYGRAVAAR